MFAQVIFKDRVLEGNWPVLTIHFRVVQRSANSFHKSSVQPFGNTVFFGRICGRGDVFTAMLHESVLNMDREILDSVVRDEYFGDTTIIVAEVVEGRINEHRDFVSTENWDGGSKTSGYVYEG